MEVVCSLPIFQKIPCFKTPYTQSSLYKNKILKLLKHTSWVFALIISAFFILNGWIICTSLE
jgi:hypothetical protein